MAASLVKKDLLALKSLLDKPKPIVIVMHQRPDADSLGTGLGLSALLTKQRHSVHVIAPSEYPAFLNWLPGASAVIVYTQGRQKQCFELLRQAAVIFCVDFPTLSRLHEMEYAVRDATATRVVIDHHPTTEQFGDLIFRDTSAAATAEILYHVIEALDLKTLVDKDIAECLYAGIMTDTGAFQHANTTATTHVIAASLMHHGADITKVSKLIYASNPLRKLRFLGFALCHRFVILQAYRTAYFFITEKDYAAYHLQTGDTEGLVDYALSVQGIVFAVVIKEKSDAVRLSFRSFGDIPVHLWAKEYFAGGGHKNAAGGTSLLTLQATVAKLESLVKEKKHILNAAV